MAEVKRESYFMRFRRRWKRRGVMEITESHPKFKFTMMVKQGLQDSVSKWSDMLNYGADEYSEKIHRKLMSSDNKTNFQFTTYAPGAFASLRNQVGLTSEEYSDCICPNNDAKYLEFVSNSKSGQIFFLSNDKQLMIKTHTSGEKDFFLKILSKYIEHLRHFPHTLLVRYLGLYKIAIGRQEPVYFIVMQSILYPDERINVRFDLKACAAGRYIAEIKEPSEIITVLKDVNFGTRKIQLGSQSSWFCSQIQHDTEFLRNLHVIDYSLLIGIQSLHLEEIKENRRMAAVVVRMKKSVDKRQSVVRHWGQSPTKTQETAEPSSSLKISHSVNSENGIETERIHLPGAVTSPVKSLRSYESSTISQPSLTESESVAQNRRLLPQCSNELHVIDGSNKERYFVGIIDFFTPYGIKKRFESLYKAMKYKKSQLSYSTVDPDAYAQRFRTFVTEHVE